MCIFLHMGRNTMEIVEKGRIRAQEKPHRTDSGGKA